MSVFALETPCFTNYIFWNRFFSSYNLVSMSVIYSNICLRKLVDNICYYFLLLIFVNICLLHTFLDKSFRVLQLPRHLSNLAANK